MKKFLQEALSEAWATTRSRDWIIPLWLALSVAGGGILCLRDDGMHPAYVATTIVGLIGAWLSLMIPTWRAMRKQWRVIEARVIADREGGQPMTPDTRERLESAGIILQRHRPLLWPAWWISERPRVRRLLSLA